MSPSDMVGPSPVTSNGTETTEIEDDVAEEVATEAEDKVEQEAAPEKEKKPGTSVSQNQAPTSHPLWLNHSIDIEHVEYYHLRTTPSTIRR